MEQKPRDFDGYGIPRYRERRDPAYALLAIRDMTAHPPSKEVPAFTNTGNTPEGLDDRVRSRSRLP